MIGFLFALISFAALAAAGLHVVQRLDVRSRAVQVGPVMPVVPQDPWISQTAGSVVGRHVWAGRSTEGVLRTPPDSAAIIVGPPKADYPRLARWAKEEGSGQLNWWEIGAACGSSLAIFAQLAAATDPALTSNEVDAIDFLYWPWAEALHILLDSLIDRAEDRATGQPNLLDHYSSQDEMTERLGLLATQTAERALEAAPHHRLILAGMVALYLSDEQAWTAFARPATERILEATGSFAKPALLMLRARRLALKADARLFR